MTARTPRPAARILLLDAAERLLLFRYDVPDRPPFWCTPGGRLDNGESYEAAARRELFEETGLSLDCGPQVAQRLAEFTAIEGHPVWADERYFLVRADAPEISADGYTAQERACVTGHRWFTRDDLNDWLETIYPTDIVQMLAALEPA